MGMFGLTEAIPQKPSGGGSWILEPGAYVCKIQKAYTGRTMSGKDKLVIEWSVAEGPSAGFGAESVYPPTENITFDPTNSRTQGFARFKLDKITESNASDTVVITNYDGSQITVPFSATNLVDNGHPEALTGKLIGFLIGVEDYTKTRGTNAGQDGERNVVVEWLTPQEVRQGFTVQEDGSHKEIVPPARRDSRKKQPQAATAPKQPEQVNPALQAYVNQTMQPQVVTTYNDPTIPF